jgi:hypothetical protein
MPVRGFRVAVSGRWGLDCVDVKQVFNRGGEIKKVNLFVFCLGGIIRGHYSIKLICRTASSFGRWR